MRTLTPLVVLLALGSHVAAGDWPCFRGPNGLAFSDENDLPHTWNGRGGENVLWKAPLRGQGQSSPIVWRDRVFVATVNWPGGKSVKEEYPEHHVTCYAVADGKELW